MGQINPVLHLSGARLGNDWEIPGEARLLNLVLRGKIFALHQNRQLSEVEGTGLGTGRAHNPMRTLDPGV